MKALFLIAIVLIALGFFGTRTYAIEENPCLVCHVKFNKLATSVHEVLASGCQACHMTLEGKKHPEQKDSIHLIRDVPQLCYDCHDRSLFKDKSVHPPVGKGLCMSCHKPHVSSFGKMLIDDPPVLCYRCHDKKLFTKKYVHVAAAIPNGCNLCHNPHAGSNQNLLLQPVFDLCTSCHSNQKEGMHILGSMRLGFGESIHPVKGIDDPSNPSKELTCTSCHTPHSSDFPNLFPRSNLCSKCHKAY